MNEAVYNWKEGDDTKHVISYIPKELEDNLEVDDSELLNVTWMSKEALIESDKVWEEWSQVLINHMV